MPEVNLRRASDATLVVLFLAGLWLPLLGVRIWSHGWDVAAPRENRRMAELPTLLRSKELHLTSTRTKLKALAKLPGEFKYYLSDHFGFRSLLIRMHGLTMVKGLGVTSNHAVVLGKEGWLYLGNDGSVEDYRNLEPFTSEELRQWRTMLEERHDQCAKLGIPYLFVFAPSKHDIYPQYMPDNLTRVHEQGRLDQLLAYLRETGSPVRVLDLRGPLLAQRDHGVRLYQKTDTHWNDRGAWIAYQAIASTARQFVPRIAPLPASDFEPVSNLRPGMDLAGLLGLSEGLPEESLDLHRLTPLRLPHVEQNMVDPITINPIHAGQPKVVVFRDSFLTAVLPFLAESFGRGVYVWEDGFDPMIVQTEHPDIVIQQIAQRKLMLPLATLRKTRPAQLSDGKWRFADDRSN